MSAGKNVVPMKELARLLEENGYKRIQTYIQSGNVILQGDTASPEGLSKLMETRFGFLPHIIVIENSEFATIVRLNPFDCKDGKSVRFYFCAETPTLNQEQLAHYKAELEEVKVVGNVLYLAAPDGIGRSKLVANMAACLRVTTTGRNLNTVNKLSHMLCEY
jgi:uncharacterized protein (DUF1697 family)